MSTSDLFLDTHILVEAIQGNGNGSEYGSRISTVVASEFLGAQGDDRTKANYYVPYVGPSLLHLHAPELTSRRDHPFPKRTTDTVLMDFGGRFPALVHFGNLAFADLINREATSLFKDAIDHLPKAKRKALRRKFEFILDHRITCTPLSESTVVTAQDLLASFLEKHELKQNFRNSWNDLLILATAVQAGGVLLTEDELLMRHAAGVSGGRAEAIDRGVAIDFSIVGARVEKWKGESKGFINRGWQVRFSQNRS